MSNRFLPPEWAPIVCQKSEAKEETWPERLCVSPYSFGKPRTFLTTSLLFFPSFLSDHPLEDKGAGGKRGQAWVSWPGRLLWLQVQEFLSLRTWRLSLFLVDEFSGPQRSYGPGDAFCAIYTCPSLVLAEQLLTKVSLTVQPPPLTSLYRGCALLSVNLMWESDWFLNEIPTLIETVGNCLFSSIRAKPSHFSQLAEIPALFDWHRVINFHVEFGFFLEDQW